MNKVLTQLHEDEEQIKKRYFPGNCNVQSQQSIAKIIKKRNLPCYDIKVTLQVCSLTVPYPVRLDRGHMSVGFFFFLDFSQSSNFKVAKSLPP